MKAWFVFFVLISSVARAEILIEPNVGGGIGSISDSITNESVNESASFFGPSGGIRFGAQADYVFLGLDAKVSYLSITSSGNSDSTTSSSNWLYTAGLTFGFTAEYIPVRVLATLDFLNIASVQNNSTTSFGFRFGVGYFLSENMILGLELQGITISQNLANNNTLSGTLRGAFATLSFPFTTDFSTTPWRERYRGRQGPATSPEPGSKDSSSSVPDNPSDLDLDLE